MHKMNETAILSQPAQLGRCGFGLLFLLPQSTISSFQTKVTTVNDSQATATGNCLPLNNKDTLWK